MDSGLAVAHNVVLTSPPPVPCTAPTKGSGVTGCGLARPPHIVLANPLLTATARHVHSPRAVAPETRGWHAETLRGAAHGAIDAGAVVLAIRLERLAVVVAHSIQDTTHADHLCKQGEGQIRLGGVLPETSSCCTAPQSPQPQIPVGFLPTWGGAPQSPRQRDAKGLAPGGQGFGQTWAWRM